VRQLSTLGGASYLRRLSVLFLALGLLIAVSGQSLAANPLASTRQYTIVDLGEPGVHSVADEMNDVGQIAGSVDAETGPNQYQGAVWDSNGGLTTLGYLSGGYNSRAGSINNLGQAVGGATTDGRDGSQAFTWTHTSGIVDIGTFGGLWASASDINDLGQVVGRYFVPGLGVRGYVWHPDTGHIQLPTFGGDTRALKLNNAGQVVGQSYFVGDEGAHAFIWDPAAGMTDLGTLGGPASTAIDVNNRGDVVGASKTSTCLFQPAPPNCTDSSLAFLWTADDGMKSLGHFGGNDSRALGINDAGQVVGYSYDRDNRARAFIWENGRHLIDLGTLGGDYAAAEGINNLGQIVGWASTGSGVSHAVLWTPFDFGESLIDGISDLDVGISYLDLTYQVNESIVVRIPLPAAVLAAVACDTHRCAVHNN
jgi:probable HAF family extracellular repeat protein